MEKSIEAAWDTIGDIQEEMKASSGVRKQLQTDLDSHKAEIVKSGTNSRNSTTTATKSKI